MRTLFRKARITEEQAEQLRKSEFWKNLTSKEIVITNFTLFSREDGHDHIPYNVRSDAIIEAVSDTVPKKMIYEYDDRFDLFAENFYKGLTREFCYECVSSVLKRQGIEPEWTEVEIYLWYEGIYIDLVQSQTDKYGKKEVCIDTEMVSKIEEFDDLEKKAEKKNCALMFFTGPYHQPDIWDQKSYNFKDLRGKREEVQAILSEVLEGNGCIYRPYCEIGEEHPIKFLKTVRSMVRFQPDIWAKLPKNDFEQYKLINKVLDDYFRSQK